MIKDIKELNFPAYATLETATATIADMGDRTITSQVKIDGDVVPDFSYDWEVEFKGERYIHPVRTPQGTKDNASRKSKIDLVFHHWAIYEMKRQYFVEMASTTAGTAIADKYIASLGLNLEDLVIAFNLVLNHYFGGRIIINLNPNPLQPYSKEAKFVSISYSYIWDVLQQMHEIYGVRWTLKTNADGVCEILMGYPAEEVSHIFEYGFEGGLLSVQRQVQSTEIRNRLLGRGGEKNLPYRYFKDKDPNNPLFEADPDWIPELANIAFTELRGKTFRDYVRGWKARRYGGTPMAEPTEAYIAGYNAEKFDPIEYVDDKESIEKYGVLVGALENNEEIYPSIQGAPGDVDMIVDAEQVTDDDVDAAIENDAVETNVDGMSYTKTGVKTGEEVSINVSARNAKVYFSIPEGKKGTINEPSYAAVGKYGDRGNMQSVPDGLITVYRDKCSFTVHKKSTGEQVSRLNIPPGEYYYEAMVVASHAHTGDINLTASVSAIHLITSTDTDSGWHQTFDIWVRNIWGSSRNAGETDQQYADRVWTPILGDRTGGEARVVFASGWLSFSSDWEFPIVGYAYDDSKNGSHWRLTLAKSEAELEASGKYIPYEGYNASAGDRFFFIGIDMPYQYVLWAEERLDDFKRDSLLKTSDINPTWVIKTDKVRLNQDREGAVLVDSLNAGAQIRLASKQFVSGAYETLYVQSVTYTWSMDTILHPDIEVVVSDKVHTVKNPVAQIQSSIETIQRQVGSLSNIQQIIRQVCDTLYLRKDGVSDISKSPTKFLGRVSGEKFREGQIGGRDWGIYRDGNGNAILEADKVIARQGVFVNDLVINEATYVGGLQINSAASMTAIAVEETDEGYVCFFDQKQGTVINKFKTDDVVLCHKFDAEDNDTKFYKARVIAVNESSVTLSKTEINGTGIPAVDDKIIHYGNYTDKDRQFVIIRDVIGGGYERMLMGLDSVTSGGVEYYYAGKAADGKARWFVGDPEQYVKYEDGKLQVRAALNILPGTTGVENIEGLPEFIHANVGDVETGESGSNLLRNSGFTGDYLSEELADDDVLTAESAMFSNPLDYWNANAVTVHASEDSESGFAVVFAEGGSLAQELYYNLIANEGYVLSFKAKSDTNATLTYTVGDQTGEVVLTPEAKRHVVKLVVTATNKTFSLACNDCSLWEVQLERGTMASSWGQSFLDNSSDRAYWQAQKYLNGALKDASTTFNGGLGLTNMILFGNYDKETKAMKEVTAGVSGNREDDNDVAFWAGGDYESAVKTSMDYLVNHKKGEWQPTDAELANMANFILTHGGTAILNDMILRGYVYALGGKIGDLIIEGNGISVNTSNGGKIIFTPMGLDARQKDGSMVGLGTCASQAIMILGKDAAGGVCYAGDYEDRYKIAAQINAADKGHAIHSLSGLFAGLRPNIRVVTDSATLDALDHTIIVKNEAQITLTLPSNARTGQTYKLIHRTNKTVLLSHPSSVLILDASKDFEEVSSFSDLTTLTLTYYEDWYAEFK